VYKNGIGVGSRTAEPSGRDGLGTSVGCPSTLKPFILQPVPGSIPMRVVAFAPGGGITSPRVLRLGETDCNVELCLKGGRNMKLTHLVLSVFIVFMASSASAQETAAPNISSTSVQGSRVDLNEFKGEKNVLVVFYRMHT
jgi:hypothetical protein